MATPYKYSLAAAAAAVAITGDSIVSAACSTRFLSPRVLFTQPEAPGGPRVAIRNPQALSFPVTCKAQEFPIDCFNMDPASGADLAIALP
ncbi:Os02g0744501 [Oryza sativa Japonica Group]|uniref:Os02g0744501 protein n=4 Tax=Oryza TaxID=4527 RepID=C7IZ39_ORYSJ|nr:hypothetical protein EE612_013646 [Oryza sativa]BAH91877.1 Os02g0744501 [Oryza sativa Japonica Group]BAS80886.1 Os02g0744501 [Oryza sativa Japonica Group]|eukprot:NP_001173148.1 Os02g0744501 [Oryza sativa Japonica Group]